MESKNCAIIELTKEEQRACSHAYRVLDLLVTRMDQQKVKQVTSIDKIQLDKETLKKAVRYLGVLSSHAHWIHDIKETTED